MPRYTSIGGAIALTALLVLTTGPAALSATPGACSVTITTVSYWPGGFQTLGTVRAGNAPINGWTVRWTWPGNQTFINVFSGSYTVSGSDVTVRNASFNGALAANGTALFGFTAYGAAAAPTATCTSP